MTKYPSSVRIREVGPRDGLQVENPIGPVERSELITALAETGLSEIEAVSFVSPKAVPSMANAAEVLERLDLRAGVTVAALVPNRRGAEMALQTQVAELTMTISASETYNQRNVHMSTAESLHEVRSVSELISRQATDRRVPVDAVISCSFGSPYEGDIAPGEVAALQARLFDAGANSVTLADTTGMATPRVIEELLELTGVDLGLHLHDTRGTGLLNLFFALERGVKRFDTSVGGLGGSPFAEGAGGNVATEDAVALLDDLGVETGVDLKALIEVSRRLERLIGRPVPSRVAHAGPRNPEERA